MVTMVTMFGNDSATKNAKLSFKKFSSGYLRCVHENGKSPFLNCHLVNGENRSQFLIENTATRV